MSDQERASSQEVSSGQEGTGGQKNANSQTIVLDGVWELGLDRQYRETAMVPGIATDPATMNAGDLWYRKQVSLPDTGWSHAVLELKGARFAPAVFVNGRQLSSQSGGMAPTFHKLSSPEVTPGAKITLEVALKSLKNLSERDASYIPTADHWRSNVSSGLWDGVVLHLYRGVRIQRLIPFVDIHRKTVALKYQLGADDPAVPLSGMAFVEVKDRQGKLLIGEQQAFNGAENTLEFSFENRLALWSPDEPNLYQLSLRIEGAEGDEGAIADQAGMSLGLKEFEVERKQFYLNGKPFKSRAGTVVWPRWVRDPEGRALGYDQQWFIKNVIKRLKDHGANTLRFHLGLPPESFLSLCDQYGLAVQYEWSFFHGLPASRESLEEQWRAWLDLAMRHPSVSLIHPYNETEDEEQLARAWQALEEILPEYPPLVLADRDVIHIHKYWWSLFENLGLYYDSADQFPKAIMADEFGGNYLDGKGDPGGYKAVKSTFLRFLGENHNRADRLQLHSLANAKIAEYWRRIGAAGFSPFTILGSHEDGSHWYPGELTKGRPKPVWQALTAAWSPRSVSLELWDRNFRPGQRIKVPLHSFNDTEEKVRQQVRVEVVDDQGRVRFRKNLSHRSEAFSQDSREVRIDLPEREGRYGLRATLLNPPARVKYPVVSDWDIRIQRAKLPAGLEKATVAVAGGELELRAFLRQQGIKMVAEDDLSADIVLTSRPSWERIESGDRRLPEHFKRAANQGIHILMLDVGKRFLGQGYPEDAAELGPLQGVATIDAPQRYSTRLFDGLALNFIEMAEPESHIHPGEEGQALWQNLDKRQSWLWNGMRGGLIVPAIDFEVDGLEGIAWLEQWAARGADESAVRRGRYYAYVLEGVYAFSEDPRDADVLAALRSRVNFLVGDAPALQGSVDPDAAIEEVNLAETYRTLSASGNISGSLSQEATTLFTPLVIAGKDLSRAPVKEIDFGHSRLIVSQLLTHGRLAEGFGEPGLYGIRYDEAAVQFVLNMMDRALGAGTADTTAGAKGTEAQK